jgi:hypothetical protein
MVQLDVLVGELHPLAGWRSCGFISRGLNSSHFFGGSQGLGMDVWDPGFGKGDLEPRGVDKGVFGPSDGAAGAEVNKEIYAIVGEGAQERALVETEGPDREDPLESGGAGASAGYAHDRARGFVAAYHGARRSGQESGVISKARGS